MSVKSIDVTNENIMNKKVMKYEMKTSNLYCIPSGVACRKI